MNVANIGTTDAAVTDAVNVATIGTTVAVDIRVGTSVICAST